LSRHPLLVAYDVHGEKFRYLIVGVWNTAVSFATFALAIRLFAEPLGTTTGWSEATVALVIQWAVWVLMVVHSTVMMKYFAFRSPGSVVSQVLRAYFVYLPAQGMSAVVLWVAMSVFGLGPIPGQVFAIAFATVFSYLGHKYFTFRVPSEDG
jgi:putative flippase GtrA